MSGTPERPTCIPTTFHGFLPPFPKRRMSEDETKALICLMMSDRSESNPAVVEELMNDFGFAVMKKRLDVYEVPCEIRVIVFMSFLCHNPGELVVMAWTMAAHYAKHKETVTLPGLMDSVYADGVPDVRPETFGPVWDLQKWGGANTIDFCPWPHQLESVKP